MTKTIEPAIIVKDVYKTFKLPHEQHTGIKQAAVSILKGGKKGYELQEALNDITFEVRKGEFFGIVGRNGSGKSTLLKLLAGIYVPDKGLVHVNGNLTPFIELGVGFNPELTGRENVYLNGALLGMSHSEIDSVYDEIVEFAELEKFMDQKLKNYSSGMQVRLAFSIAIRAHGDILLIDEVLAVGDERFQQKCLTLFEKIKKDKSITVVFVSHDMQSVQKFCDRALLIHDSRVQYIGDSSRVALEYKKLNFPEMMEQLEVEKDIKTTKRKSKLGEKVRITKFEAIDSEGIKDRFISSMRPFTFRFYYEVKEDIENIILGVAIKNKSNESIYGPNTGEMNIPISLKKGGGSFDMSVANNIFTPGEYTVEAGIFNDDHTVCYDYISLKNAVVFVGVDRNGYAYVEPEWIVQ